MYKNKVSRTLLSMTAILFIFPGLASAGEWVANGTDIYYNAGNVGIGTTSPSQRLTVSGLIETVSTDQSMLGIRLTNTNGRQYDLVSGIRNVGQVGFSIYDVTAGATRLTIGNTGNVGIGTSMPGKSLSIYGTSTSVPKGFDLGVVDTRRWKIEAQPYVTDRYDLHITQNDYPGNLVLTDGTRMGNVGIGMTNPYFKFEVRPATDSRVGIGAMSGNPTIVGLNDSGASRSLRIAGYPLIFTGDGGSGAEAMRVTSSGNVGIGTTTPQAKLDINGTIRNSISGNALANNFTAAFNTGLRIIDSSTPKLDLWHDGSSVGQFKFTSNTLSYGTHTGNDILTERLVINSSGNVGIGTTDPAYKLQIQGGGASADVVRIANSNNISALIARFGSITGDGYAGLQSTKTAGAINDLILNPSGGNVGIGTTTPQSKLAVNGTITAKEVNVTVTGWADYVFAEGYKLPALHEVEAYIQTNKHLPGVPSESTVKKDGLALSEIAALQMQKIEELTLYMIELKKENEQLNKRLAALESR